jgi:hypothetical protein
MTAGKTGIRPGESERQLESSAPKPRSQGNYRYDKLFHPMSPNNDP